jgi:hypothetical protein
VSQTVSIAVSRLCPLLASDGVTWKRRRKGYSSRGFTLRDIRLLVMVCEKAGFGRKFAPGQPQI